MNKNAGGGQHILCSKKAKPVRRYDYEKLCIMLLLLVLALGCLYGCGAEK